MPLLQLQQVSIAYGLHPLLDGAHFQLDQGERACLIGRNGEGKSTLLSLCLGAIQPDSGTVWIAPNVRLASLQQELPDAATTSVFDYVAQGIPKAGALLLEYHQLTQHEPDRLNRIAELQHQIEMEDGWRFQQKIEAVMDRLELPTEATLGSLSGGWKRRVALAHALVGEPDILLLDEPTNHLDIEAVEWLENELLNFRGAVLFITHDRHFLERLATTIWELDRGQLKEWRGNYAYYQEKKAAFLEEETRHHALFDKKLAQEEVWIRQGIKARRTRNEGRVRALKALREEHKQRRNLQGNARFSLEAAEKSGKLVFIAEQMNFTFQDRTEAKCIVNHFSTVVQAGDKIALLGPNGAGKSTVLKLLLGDLQPDSGMVKQGTKLQIAYFDQQRAQLDLEKSILDNLAEGQEFLEIHGERKHVISYLQEFLFSPQRIQTPVKSLSGGERNRLLLAKLFSQPANVLVLDEPTNDLDLESLELLETLLVDYPGTLLLVSHDRAFIDHVALSCWLFAGNGVIEEYPGGYTDAMQQHRIKLAQTQPAKKAQEPVKEGSKPKSRSKPKLTFGEEKELEKLPAQIEALETQQATLAEQTSHPEFYQQDAAEQQRVLQQLTQLGEELASAYTRWEELDAKQV